MVYSVTLNWKMRLSRNDLYLLSIHLYLRRFLERLRVCTLSEFFSQNFFKFFRLKPLSEHRHLLVNNGRFDHDQISLHEHKVFSTWIRKPQRRKIFLCCCKFLSEPISSNAHPGYAEPIPSLLSFR